ELGIGQRQEAIQPYGIDAGQSARGDPMRGAVEAGGAESHGAVGQLALHFTIDGEERRGERRAGIEASEAGEIASGGREFLNRLGERGAESGRGEHASELGWGEAAG